MERLDRNIRFFGREGQDKLRLAQVAVVGTGGLGSHVVQQIAYLGVGHIALIDHEELDTSNKNRYVTAYYTDTVPGSRKVDLSERMVRLIDPSIVVTKVFNELRSEDAFDAIKAANYIFGCVDNDGARLVLTELCAAYQRPYFDLATEIIPGPPVVYGGRLCVSWNGQGCLVCFGQLDLVEAGNDLEGDAARQDRKNLYGVEATNLNVYGPSVVSINGVVASLGVTEFAVAASGIRPPHKLLNYRGDFGRVTSSADKPSASCYYCKEVFGLGRGTAVERYLSDKREKY